MKLPALSICVGLVIPFTAHALDAESLQINGFGSIIGSMTSDEDDSLYGIDDDLSFQTESRFAVQVSSKLSDQWSATAQILARGENDFTPAFEWAYLAYQATPDLKLFFGRQRFKQYKYSGYVDVGYTYPWIRPPQGVYSVPFSSGDGLGAAYQTYAGDIEINLQYNLLGTKIEDFVPSTGGNEATIDIELGHILSLDFNYNNFNFGANASYLPNLSYDIVGANPAAQAIFDGANELRLAGLLPGQIANDIFDLRNDKVSALDLNFYAGWDNGDLFVLGEYDDQRFSESAFSDQKSWYLTGGVRISQFTVHASYGKDKNTASTDIAQSLEALAATAPAPLQPTLAGLAGGARALQDAQLEDSTFYNVGVRYDFDVAVALKADFTSVKDDDNPQREADIYAVGLDFVF